MTVKEWALPLSHPCSVFLHSTSHHVVGRMTAPQRCMHPNPQILCLCFVTWQRGVHVADGIKFANLLTFK